MVEVCTDEMEPLLIRGLIRPLDPKAVTGFDDLAFSDSDEVRDEAGNVLFVPASAGPHGLIVNTDEVDPRRSTPTRTCSTRSTRATRRSSRRR